MRTRRRLASICAVVIVLVGTAAVAPSTSAARSPIDVILDGLSSPKGLDVTPEGAPVVAQGAFGPPGPVLVVPLGGPDRRTAIPVTDPVSLIDVAISPLDGTGWAIGPNEAGSVVLFHQLVDGTIVEVLDITAYQAGDPDPVDQEGEPTESNPYGLTILPNGDALVADAAGNDLIRVTPAGVPVTVARFDVQTILTDHLPPGPEPTPPSVSAEAVPTTVTIGPDGAIYVGELKGFPFRPGSSNIWRIEPDAVGAFCSVTAPSADCSLYLTGFTAIQDIDFAAHGDRLYVYELAADGVLAFEEGLETGAVPPAVLLEVRKGVRTELAAGLLFEPGGVAVAAQGHKVFVTDGVFSEGRLIRVH